jgi:hypothetical protein
MDVKKLTPHIVRGVVRIVDLMPDHFRTEDVSSADGLIPRASDVLLKALTEARALMQEWDKSNTAGSIPGGPPLPPCA